MKYKRVEQGNRFGRLTCMEKVNAGGFGGATWRCACECGRETDVSEAMLLSGIVRSCGCRSGRTINLQGERFGMLTVLEPVPERAIDGSVRWLCRCECGNYATLSTNKLNMGRSTSCGCNIGVRAKEAKTYIDGTCVEIMLSDTVSKNNTSGYRGVAKKRDKWQAYITDLRYAPWLGRARKEIAEMDLSAYSLFALSDAAEYLYADKQTFASSEAAHAYFRKRLRRVC